MGAVEELRARLEAVPLFAGCNRSDLLVVAMRCELRDVPEGTALIRGGEVGDEFFVLLQGEARRGHGDDAHDLGPGDYFGELALLDPAPRSLDVVTTTAAQVGVLSRANFLLVVDAVPGVSSQMLTFLARRLRAAETRNVGTH